MSARVTALIFSLALSGCAHNEGDNAANLTNEQAQVAERGRSVMPFDLDRTMHHFRKLPTGGIQQVLSTDGDGQQVTLIRLHLETEAVRFQQGDFSDPSSIHGPQMPGLRALAAGARHIEIRYSDIPGGGQVTYATSDPRLVSAIHTWFDAQLREHGHHAMPM